MNGEDLLVLDQIKVNQELLIKKMDSVEHLLAMATDRKISGKEACMVARISRNTLKKMVLTGKVTQFKEAGQDPTYLFSDVVKMGNQRYKHSKK